MFLQYFLNFLVVFQDNLLILKLLDLNLHIRLNIFIWYLLLSSWRILFILAIFSTLYHQLLLNNSNLLSLFEFNYFIFNFFHFLFESVSSFMNYLVIYNLQFRMSSNKRLHKLTGAYQILREINLTKIIHVIHKIKLIFREDVIAGYI